MGQGEIEVVSVADLTVLVLVPGLGDDVQMMKAGIMEIGDLIVLNKADRPGMDQLETVVRASLEFVREGRPVPQVVKCSVATGEGLEDLFSKLDDLLSSGRDFEAVRRGRVRRTCSGSPRSRERGSRWNCSSAAMGSRRPSTWSSRERPRHTR